MLGGYVILFISVAALLPWGNDYPSIQIPSKILLVNKYGILFLVIYFFT